ncbi:hypothetical protein PV08_09455 [Exophiala spinifera]|uniref:Methyltransferase domain-containing protein n=1 Tax=Exophiala spinifera TaxID=91928 RepID=A0A0D2BLW4_9EURO|nr:uncharacterized protein PV08_09455 [Exophiala spinifera]KIW12179.1 hypothetical protein PV08_09455 [Exophiala spinifera]
MAARSTGDEDFHRKVTYCDREYQEHSVRYEIYQVPIDAEEETRLLEQHEMLKLIYTDWNNGLYAPIVGEPEAILDCGFGTGAWAYDVAEYDPNCMVTAIDICPLLAPSDQLENIDFQIANLNHRLDCAEPNTFDLINSRFVASGIAATRWPNYFRDMHRLLKSGGWVQMTEWDLFFRSDSDNSDALQALHEWSRLYTEALGSSTRPEGKKRSRVVQDFEVWMRMAGFINVSTDVRDIPTCAWPQDAHNRSIGEANLTNMKGLIHSLGLYPVTSRRLREIEDFHDLIEAAYAELSDVGAKPYIRLHTTFGMKR